jgi:membrane-associated protein
MRGLIESVSRMGTVALLALAFGLGVGEGAIGLDLVVPGEVGMVFVGAAAEEAGVPLLAVIPPAAAGAVIGDSLGYLIGRRFGVRVLCRWDRIRDRVEPALERSTHYFERRGPAAVFTARWVGALRGVVPVAAGIAEMPYRRFLAWDVPAAVLWSTAIVSLGWYVGDDVAGVVDRVGLVVSTVVVACIVAIVVVRRRRPGHEDGRGQRPAGASGPRLRRQPARSRRSATSR